MADAESEELRAKATLTVIVHYGDRSLTARAIASVAAMEPRPGGIVVVDNGPPADRVGNDPLRMAVTEIQGATLLEPGCNLGFAAGVAHALDAALREDVRFVWLLNNDATAQPDTLRELLLASHRAADRALVSSLVCEVPSGAVWFTSARFYPWWMRSWIGRRSIDSANPDVVFDQPVSWRSVPYLPATSLLLPADALRSIGGLDPIYFVYGEDVELALRARRAGLRLVLATRSVIHHRTSSASVPAAKVRMIATGALLLTARHYPWLLPFAIPAAILEGARRAVRQRDASLLTARLKGYGDALRRLSATRPSSPAPAAGRDE